MSVASVKATIKNIFLQKRIAQIEAIDRFYASLAINYFRQVQPPNIGRKGLFWHNQTAQAAIRVFANAFRENFDFGWLISHGVEYGIYLEKANDGAHAALWPIVKRFAGRYYKDIQKLYED